MQLLLVSILVLCVGYVKPGPVKPDSNMCYKLDTDYYGGDILIKNDKDVTSAASCHALCWKTDKCVVWTFYPKEGYGCFIKGDKHNPASTLKDAISGHKYCQTCKPETCKLDTDYYGGDIKNDKDMTSAASCQDLCVATDKCKAWTFYPKEGYGCFIKGDNHKPASTLKDAISGNKYCQTCYKLDTDYYGGDIKNDKDMTSAASCQALCMETDKCVAWTFYPKEGYGCFIKGDNHKPASTLKDAISGYKDCQ